MYIIVKKKKRKDGGGTWPKGQNINNLSQFLTKNFNPFLPFSRFFFLFLFFFSFIFFFISFLHGSLQPNVFPLYSLHHSSWYSSRFHQISKPLLHLRLVFSSSSSFFMFVIENLSGWTWRIWSIIFLAWIYVLLCLIGMS